MLCVCVCVCVCACVCVHVRVCVCAHAHIMQVEGRDDGKTAPELRMKFWQFISSHQR